MNGKERTEFWNVLNSVDGKDIVSDYTKISETIKYPSFLYRFRPITEYSLDNLKTNTLYFSSAVDYDDPFDSFIHIDKVTLNKKIDCALGSFSNVDTVKKLTMQVLNKSITDEEIKQAKINNFGKETMLETVDNVLYITRNYIRNTYKSVCFSEDSTNRALWLKYGENHKGFCLAYDIESLKCSVIGQKRWIEQIKSKEFFNIISRFLF